MSGDQSKVAHQATCVAVGGRAVLIEGPPGSGKSSLALALVERGAALVGDDGLLLEVIGGRLLASPHPRVAGLLEIRNVGLVDYGYVESVPVCLVILLDRQAPRFIEEAERTFVAGADLPLVRLYPDTPMLALRADAALKKYGLNI